MPTFYVYRSFFPPHLAPEEARNLVCLFTSGAHAPRGCRVYTALTQRCAQRRAVGPSKLGVLSGPCCGPSIHAEHVTPRWGSVSWGAESGAPRSSFQTLRFAIPTQRGHCGRPRFPGLRRQAPASARLIVLSAHIWKARNTKPSHCAHLESINQSLREATPNRPLSRKRRARPTRGLERLLCSPPAEQPPGHERGGGALCRWVA